jgi:ketosteroid isomerase-like protein
MKRTLLALAVAISLSTTATGQSTQLKADRNASEEQKLLKLEREWTEAYKDRNEKALRELLADDFIITDDEGLVSNKEQYIAAIMKQIKLHFYTLEDLTVRIYGDTGVVAGLWKGKFTVDGKDASGPFATRTYS